MANEHVRVCGGNTDDDQGSAGTESVAQTNVADRPRFVAEHPALLTNIHVHHVLLQQLKESPRRLTHGLEAELQLPFWSIYEIVNTERYRSSPASSGKLSRRQS